MKGTLTRLASTGDSGHLRTTSVKGEYLNPPREGFCFYIYGESLVGTGVRQVNTSKVVSINGKIFTTKSGSMYQLEPED